MGLFVFEVYNVQVIMLIHLQCYCFFCNISILAEGDNPITSPYLVHGFITGTLYTKVDHSVGQSPAHVELQGQIVHPLK